MSRYAPSMLPDSIGEKVRQVEDIAGLRVLSASQATRDVSGGTIGGLIVRRPNPNMAPRAGY
jgi:hypothetical protein